MFFTSIAARTDLGLVRQGNEDSALYHPSLIAVADGMGGAVGGEIASKIAIKVLAKRIEVLASKEIDEDSRIDIFHSALFEIDSALKSEIAGNSQLSGMGTTLTALAPLNGSIALLHIGDSRAYRIRGEEITRLSHDHTVVQELIDQGKITSEEASDHPQRSMLTQALMGKSSVNDFEIFPTQIFPLDAEEQKKEDDIFLLASDGLSAVLDDQLIAKIVSSGPLDQAANNLIAATRDGGAPDNVTLILAKVSSEPIETIAPSFLGAAHE